MKKIKNRYISLIQQAVKTFSKVQIKVLKKPLKLKGKIMTKLKGLIK